MPYKEVLHQQGHTPYRKPLHQQGHTPVENPHTNKDILPVKNLYTNKGIHPIENHYANKDILPIENLYTKNDMLPIENATPTRISFGVHPLWMTTSSSSTLNVGLAVAEEANACVALSTTKWALINRIRNWAEHWSMLMSATASESCSRIVFIVKV